MKKVESHKESKSRRKIIIAIIAALGFLVIICGAGFLWLYNGSISPAKTKIFKVLSLPMVMVNGHAVPMSQYLFRLKLAGLTDVSGKSSLQIANKLITEEEIRQLAERRNIFVSSKQLDTEISSVKAQAQAAGTTDFQSLLSSYGFDENSYKTQVVMPRLLLTNLQIWFYSQPDLNQQTYSLADELSKKIQNGEDIGQLAQAYSQDASAKTTQGDLGFIDVAKILPELREPISALKSGDIKILSSRDGVYVVKVDEINGNEIHLKEIFLKPLSFDAWLASQEQTFKVFKF